MKNIKVFYSFFLSIVVLISICPVCSVNAKEIIGNWTTTGVAYFDETNDYYVLTPNNLWKKGAIWFSEQIKSDFTLTFDYFAGSRADGADGLAVVYYEENVVSGTGGSSVINQLKGYAVFLDTYDNGYEPIKENHISINKNLKEHLIWAPLPESEDASWHNLKLVVCSGVSYVYVDNNLKFSYETPQTGYGLLCITAATGASKSMHAVKNIVLSDSAEPEKIFLDGYNKGFDKYSFLNQTTKIDKSYYDLMYSPVHAAFFAFKCDGTRGQCFGMATTTALFLGNSPNVKDVTCYDDEGNELTADCIANLNVYEKYDSYINAFKLNLSDFIKYAQIVQFASCLEKQERDSSNEYDNIIDAVKSYVNGGEPIVITVDAFNRSHALLPVGYKETSDSFIIYVDDSNRYQSGQEIVFKYNDTHTKIKEWSYLDYGTDNLYYSISYSKPCDLFYSFCSNTTKFRSVNENLMSTDKLLVINDDLICVTNSNNGEVIYDTANQINDNICEIKVAAGDITTERMFWVDEQIDEFDIKAENGDVEFMLADGHKGVAAKIKEGESINCKVDDSEELYFALEQIADANLDFSLLVAKDNGDIAKINVTGNASSDNVFAMQTEDGFSVSGIEDCEISLLINDEVVETKTVSDSISDIDIVYDNSSDELFDVIYDTVTEEETDTDTDTDTDAKDCNHICHSDNGFLQFIWKIYNFLMKLFSMEKYCSCGVAHY